MHPATQCRLDTYFEGALCEKSPMEPMSNTDFHGGSCTQDQGARIGYRPRCWFAPGTQASDDPSTFQPVQHDILY
jgi:hypothetical protein